jgi:hypothetical protein
MYEALEIIKNVVHNDAQARTLYDTACVLTALGQKIPAIQLIIRFTGWKIPYTKKWVEDAGKEHVLRIRMRRTWQTPVPAVCQCCGDNSATFFVIDTVDSSQNFWCTACYFSFEASREAQRVFDTFIAQPLWPTPYKHGDNPHPVSCSVCNERAAYLHKPDRTDGNTQALCPWHTFERRRIIRSWGRAPHHTIELMKDHYDF